MPTPTRTFTRTHNAVRFADPYELCRQCGDWIDGFLNCEGPTIVIPCEHRSDYRDVCPSWGPVDGCRCEILVRHPMRRPRAGDDRTY